MLLWLLPVVIGLLLSPWLVMLTSRRDLGVWTRRAGLFSTPEELRPSQLLLEGGTEWDNVVQIAPAQISRHDRAPPGYCTGAGELMHLPRLVHSSLFAQTSRRSRHHG